MLRKIIVSTAVFFMLSTGNASAQVQYPPESTTTTQPGATTTTRPGVAPTVPPGNPPRVGGFLARTGVDGIASAVRVGTILLVVGFLLYLVGRNRRAAGSKGDTA